MPDSSVGQAWAKRFDQESNPYRLEGGLPFLRRFMRSPFVQLPQRYARLGAGSHVLEAGCGSAKFSVCFALLGCNVTALDYSSAVLRSVASLIESVSCQVGPLSVTLVEGDLERLTLEPAQFDLVVNEGVVEHWLDDAARRRVIAEMARMARPGGAVAVIVPNGGHPRMGYWQERAPSYTQAPLMIRYAPAILRDDLASAGLQDIAVDGLYAWRTLDHWPTGRVRRIAGGALQRLIPLPRRLRLAWGIHLIGLGRAP